MCRLKKFTDPESSKFKSEKRIKDHSVRSDGPKENQQFDQNKVEMCKNAYELIKNSIEWRVKCSMKKLILKEE